MLDKFWLILIIVISGMGVFFSKKINFKNYDFKTITKKINRESLYLALGTKMGVGSIIGTAMSIYVGGPGALLWVYLFTLFTSSIIYVESYLGSKYKQKLNNEYVGGIYYYTKYGLKNSKLAILALVLFVSTYSFFFLMIQTNTITNIINVNNFIIFVILSILLILILTSNTKEVRKIINKIVPLMCMFFILISLYAILKKIDQIPKILKDICFNAFNPKSFLTGLVIGIKRSIFLNELLIGTTSMSSGINNEKSENTANTLILGSYFIVFIISTLIALLLLMYLNSSALEFNSYIELLMNTFSYHFGSYGIYFLTIIICLLSISTIISGIYIGISNITYITKNKKTIIFFKFLMFIFITSGIFLNTNIIWKYIDIMMLILITLNSYIIIKLRNNI